MEAENLRKQAALVLLEGRNLETRNADVGRMTLEALGGSLASPSLFWAGAVEAAGGADSQAAQAVALQLEYASLRMQAGDMEFARQSLIGQSVWLGALAVRLAARSEDEPRFDRAQALIKSALASQRQAAQALVSAASLNAIEREGGRLVSAE